VRRSALGVRFLGSLIVLAAALVFGVASAQAKTVNLVPNPGFETGPCGFDGPIICDWSELVGTISQDFDNPHSGTASMQLTGPPAHVEATTNQNICIKLHPGPHVASFWYRTSNAEANRVALSAAWFPNATCSVATFGFDQLGTDSPITNGQWQELSGTLTAPAHTGSARLAVFEGCDNCTEFLTVNFDDLYLEGHVRNTP
jgi:hypothetical protein